MANLRLLDLTVLDSSNILCKFSHPLSKSIGVENFTLSPETPGIDAPNIKSVNILNDTATLTVQPLKPQAVYLLILQSTDDVIFKSLNSDAVIINDNSNNSFFITGPIEPENPIKLSINNLFKDNVYDLSPGTSVSSYIDAISLAFSKALYNIGQAKNDNYLSFNVVDELKIRGDGAQDRLNQEGAYEIVRVGLTPTNTINSAKFSLDSFPDFPVSLLSTVNSESIETSNIDIAGFINVKTLIINCSKSPVIIVSSIKFIYNSILAPFIYNIEQLGYQLKNSDYDPEFAFTYLLLENNQVKLNDTILQDPLFSLENIASIEIIYKYKNEGLIINPSTVNAISILNISREVLPPLENIFNLQHGQIVDSSNNSGSIGDILFFDPNAIPDSGNLHPAFLYEISFRFEQLPSRPGEYSIDYSTGTVYVYGESSDKTGTGAYPPLATYSYRLIYQENIDYVYDEDISDIVSLPNGNLKTSSAIISYNFEQSLVNGIDFISNPHQEALSERIENRILALNTVQPLNFPITNVFRVFNETSGEIYKVVRWNDQKIFFNYQTPPNILENKSEKISFDNVVNETLFINSVLGISPTTQIFKIILLNNNIIANSEDSIGRYGNSSVSLSNDDIFIQEHYFDGSLSESSNLNQITNIGDYTIDYLNGIICVLVSTAQELSIGTISYKRGYIKTNSKHITSVQDIYFKLNYLSDKSKSVNYISFTDNLVLPNSFNTSSEQFYPGTTTPYQLFSSQVGTFDDADFSAGIGDNVKGIRGLFERIDLINNITPIDFSSQATFNGKIISVAPITFQEYHSVEHDGSGYFITTNTNLEYISPGISFTASVLRLSDSMPLWNTSGTIQIGSPFLLRLPGINSPSVGQAVSISYTFTINSLSRVVVDYSRGDYLIDYNYLADEIILSYEYGDNVIDFSKSLSVESGDQYYVSYKAGALRDALLRNFGSLIDIPILNNLNVDFNRERYRDALMAALQSFTSGPTVLSLENIVKHIVHTPPEVIESTFENWDLSSSLLYPEKISSNQTEPLAAGKYGNGIVVSNSDDVVSFPTISNLRLEEGTLEMWVSPQWNGIDNQSELTFTITKDNIIPPNYQIFLGPGGDHPETFIKSFSVSNINNNLFGYPNKNKDGIYIYLLEDSSGLFTRWFVDVVDGYGDGYVASNLKINIKSNGSFYDAKSSPNSVSSFGKLSSGTDSLLYSILNPGSVDEGITFTSDYKHYLFDFGTSENSNRFSIYRDEAGYLNYRIVDNNHNIFKVSSDISSWIYGQDHHIAVSWKLNSKNQADEMHLFIDGSEVSNIISYGSSVSPRLHQKFRTISTHEIIGLINDNIVSSTDLRTTAGTNTVSSSLNFTDLNIQIGDIIYIEEMGFNQSGYSITNVNGDILSLSVNLPITASSCNFSINKISLDITDEIDLYKNIAISTISIVVSGSDLITTQNLDTVSSVGKNFTTLGIKAGYLIKINAGGFAEYYTVVSVSGHSLTVSDLMPLNGSGQSFDIYSNFETEIQGQRALNPSYVVVDDGYFQNKLTIRGEVAAKDILLLRTLGLNHGRVKNKYYSWGNSSNILNTRLPAPISLSDVQIFHTIIDTTNIGPSNSSLSLGIFTSNHIATDQPSFSDNGRTLSITISGDNIDYSTSISVAIRGTRNGIPATTETVLFTENESKNTVGKFSQIDYIITVAKPINTSNNACTVKIRELYPITEPENSQLVPVIRFSYQMLVGNTLSGNSGSNIVQDLSVKFSKENINNFLILHSPSSIAGAYKIVDVSSDLTEVSLDTTFGISFTGGNYEILNTTKSNTGLQNGKFTFEQDSSPGMPYSLVQGGYELDYHAGLSIQVSPGTSKSFIGSDLNKENISNCVIDQFIIYNNILSDTRVGETVPSGQDSITKHFNSIKPLNKNINTLMYLNFDTDNIINNSDYYLVNTKGILQSGDCVNSNFGKSIKFTDNPLIIDNSGILNTKTEGTIEFWISPLFDTYNDPNFRFYFDAGGAISEKVISKTNSIVKVAGKISSILSVKLKIGDQQFDYFAGGSIENDLQTIHLNNRLPNQQTEVVINYIPTGLNGDRISIYKDPYGYINFNLTGNNTDYQVRAPVFWTKNSWHKLRAQYKINKGLGFDELRLFIDGYEQGNILFGNGLLFGQHQVFGSSFIGHNTIQASISFKDTVNEFSVGSDYTGSYGAYALIDNFKISNVARPVILALGESIDPSFNKNTSLTFPTTSDLFTTLLLDFNELAAKTTDFAIIKNRETGLFDITLNVFDEFDILKENEKAKIIMETLISALKPANSRCFINYEN